MDKGSPLSPDAPDAPGQASARASESVDADGSHDVSEPPRGAWHSSPNQMTIRMAGLPVVRRPRPTPAPVSPLARAVSIAAERADQASLAPTVAAEPGRAGDRIAAEASRPANVNVGGGEPTGAKPAMVTIRAGNAWVPEPEVPAPAAASDPATPATPATPAGPAAPDAAAAHAPVRVGAYEVAARIARGGMGSLYVCRRAGANDGRLLTMKVVREHTIQHDLAAASFRHEALIGSLLRHPNAQTVIDQGVHEGQPFLIYDYVDGGALADLLVEETRPTPAIVVSIFLDVLAALHATHQATDSGGKPLGLVHCDISPENVLVGVDGIARLADFGSARFAAIKNESQPFAVSKPPYMPPEQFRGDKLDSRSDIYAAGVLLWTALTGQQPFAAENYDATVMNVMRKKIKPPSAHGAPRCLDDVCMQALSRAPDGRFVMASAMASALRTAAEARNLVETREGVGQWVRRSMGEELARRHRLVEAMFSGPRVAVAARGTAPHGSTDGAAKGAAERTRTPAQGARSSSPAARSGGRARRKHNLSGSQQVIIALACAFAFSATVVVGVAISRRSPPDGMRAARTSTAALDGAIGANQGGRSDGHK